MRRGSGTRAMDNRGYAPKRTPLAHVARAAPPTQRCPALAVCWATSEPAVDAALVEEVDICIRECTTCTHLPLRAVSKNDFCTQTQTNDTQPFRLPASKGNGCWQAGLRSNIGTDCGNNREQAGIQREGSKYHVLHMQSMCEVTWSPFSFHPLCWRQL